MAYWPMAKPILDEGLWAVLELLLPPDPPRPRGGRPRVPHRQVLTGILFVLRSGIPWELLPQELGCGWGMTCWRSLREWHAKGVWQRIHHELLNWLGQLGLLDWSRASLDGSVATLPILRKNSRFGDFAQNSALDSEVFRHARFVRNRNFYARIQSLQHFPFKC